MPKKQQFEVGKVYRRKTPQGDEEGLCVARLVPATHGPPMALLMSVGYATVRVVEGSDQAADWSPAGDTEPKKAKAKKTKAKAKAGSDEEWV